MPDLSLTSFYLYDIVTIVQKVIKKASRLLN
jgi:hypothetical protein